MLFEDVFLFTIPYTFGILKFQDLGDVGLIDPWGIQEELYHFGITILVCWIWC